ncbi:MAG: hypothetical protein SV186_03920 [Candidatus Nanohaloarchaea archaeon]|nr:hypothetical protein [Candidatus Nanohaloarchaea archaeon]
MKPFPDEEYEYRERVRRFVQRMDDNVDAIIVEGESDKRVLRRLGAESRIFTSGGRSPEPFAETVARVTDRLVILTDFDEHGKELNKEFQHLLREDVTIFHAYRRDFGKLLTSSGRHCVEDLRPLFDSRFEKFVDAKLDRLFTPFS